MKEIIVWMTLIILTNQWFEVNKSQSIFGVESNGSGKVRKAVLVQDTLIVGFYANVVIPNFIALTELESQCGCV